MDLSIYNDSKDIEIFPNGKIFRICYDSSQRKLRIISSKYNLFEDLRNTFSIFNNSSFFVAQYGYRTAPRLYAINKFGYFSDGLLFEILNYIKTNYGSTSVLAISENCKKYIFDFIVPLKGYFQNKNNIKDISNVSEDLGRNTELVNLEKSPYIFRDYQKESIKHLLYEGYGRGLIEIPTAGGKSFILANFIWNILKNVNRQYKTLILVPNKQLVEQFYKDLKDYGYSEQLLTRLTAGLKKNEKFNIDAKIIVANRQYLFKNKNLLPKIDVLIVDEVHQATAEVTKEFIESLNCKIKIGCSGTLPRDKYLKWQLIGMFGKVVYTEDIVKLQREGYISKLKITLLKITDSIVESDRNLLFNLHSYRRYKPDEFGYSEIMFNEAHDAEHKYYNEHYKDLYTPVLNYLNSLTENILVLFDRIEVGKNLTELAREILKNKVVHYIDGSIKVDVRENIRTQLESSGNNILFAENSVFATGINIKRLTHIVFACGTKSFSRVLQSIGRTLRLHESKSEAHLVDVAFNMKYSQRHLYERLQIYKDMYNKKPDEILKYTI